MAIFSQPKCVTLDIGTSSVKVMLSEKFNPSKITGVGYASYSASCIEDGYIEHENTLIECIEQAMEQVKIKPKGSHVRLSISGRDVFTKLIKLQEDDLREIKMLLPYEVEQYFNCSPQQVKYDFRILKSKHEKNPREKYRLLLTGASKRMMDQRLLVLKKMGMIPLAIDPESTSVANLFEYLSGKERFLNSITLDIGASKTKLNFFKNGDWVNSRILDLGGRDYTKAIMENLNIDYAHAETLKILSTSSDASIPKNIFYIIHSYHEQAMARLHQAISLTLESDIYSEPFKPERLYVGGGGCLTRGLLDRMKHEFGVPLRSLNPFMKEPYFIKTHPELESGGFYYPVAMGLTLGH